MQKAAILHQPYGAFANPIDTQHIRLVLRAAVGDLKKVEVLHGDPYQPLSRMSLTALTLEATSELHDYWTALLTVESHRLRYVFHLYGKDGSEVWLHEGGLTSEMPEPALHYHYAYIHFTDLFALPSWVIGKTIYEIFPDRFANGDPDNDPQGTLKWGDRPKRVSFFGGDLAGIASRLDYLADLGIGAIYLTPVFKSPSNHKYDTADYLEVDPAFGGKDTLVRLVEDAHKKGIRVILDGVFNHSGKEWFAFRDVILRGADSRFKDWFQRIDSFPINLHQVNYETFANALASMPKLKTSNPECAEYLIGVGEYWLKEAKIDGWRLDVADEIDHGFWRSFRHRMKRIQPEAFLVGETWHDASRWLLGEQFDSVMHYPWREAALAFLRGEDKPSRFASRLTELRFRYPLTVQPGLLHLLGSHDTPRIRTLLNGSILRARQAATLLLTAPGIPLVYYGDEIGMEGGKDPDCRRCMLWDEQRQNKQLRNLYRRLIRFRRQNPWLAWGGWSDTLIDDSNGVYCYERFEGGPLSLVHSAGRSERRLWVVLNQRRNAQTVGIPISTYGAVVDLITGRRFMAAGGHISLPIAPWGEVILVPESLDGTDGSYDIGKVDIQCGND